MEKFIIGFEILFFVGFVVLGIWGFINAVESRKYYKCPNCGEKFRAENMDALNCSVCGADLSGLYDKDNNE